MGGPLAPPRPKSVTQQGTHLQISIPEESKTVVTKPLGTDENKAREDAGREDAGHEDAGHEDAGRVDTTRARFGAFAQRYVTSQAHAQGEDLERLVEIGQPEPDWFILDVATGGGHTALRFAPWAGHVVATDLTAKMLAAARAHIGANGATNVTYGVADGQDLPFQAQTFDLVTCRIAPHHFTDCARFVREGARVLKPGGRLLVQDHLLPEDPAAARYIDAFERLRDPSHHRAYAESEWVALFRKAGLRVEHTEQLVKEHPFLPWAERQDCSPETIERLVEMMETASKAVIEWMRPRGFQKRDPGTREASFINRHILLAGRK
jgi:ubiquinone/menaquinone biosynthesis C-methylase UbiE